MEDRTELEPEKTLRMPTLLGPHGALEQSVPLRNARASAARPRSRRMPRPAGHFTVKLTEERTVPASSVISTRQLPALIDLELQVRVEVYLSSRAFSKTF